VEHVGIDLHRMESQICVLQGQGEVIERRVRTDRESLERALRPHRGARVLLEAATESEWVARWLESLGHEVVVADPNYAPMYAYRSRRVKTDRRDARTLAEALRVGAYRPAHRVSESQRQVRMLLTVREVLVRARTRAIVVVRSLLRQHGVRVRTGVSETFTQRARQVGVAGPAPTLLAPLLETIDQLTGHIRVADRQLEGLARGDRVVEQLRSVPGIGPVTALAFVATLDGIARFASAHQVESYLGLVPSERSSGEKQRRGRLAKTGNSRLRWLLVEAAWRIMLSRRADVEHLQRWTARIAARRGRRIAVVALARRLAGILYALWRDGSTYQPRVRGHVEVAEMA